mgnify:CR=1 FL=1
MKKVIFFLSLMLMPLLCTAQTYKFKTDSFAYKTNNNGRWSNWSDWEDSSMLVVINTDRDVITIYSKETQEYDIVENLGTEKDREGGEQLKFLCVNEDGARCHIRIRVQKDGQRQLYVDFSDIMFVYGITDR